MIHREEHFGYLKMNPERSSQSACYNEIGTNVDRLDKILWERITH